MWIKPRWYLILMTRQPESFNCVSDCLQCFCRQAKKLPTSTDLTGRQDQGLSIKLNGHYFILNCHNCHCSTGAQILSIPIHIYQHVILSYINNIPDNFGGRLCCLLPAAILQTCLAGSSPTCGWLVDYGWHKGSIKQSSSIILLCTTEGDTSVFKCSCGAMSLENVLRFLSKCVAWS